MDVSAFVYAFIYRDITVINKASDKYNFIY